MNLPTTVDTSLEACTEITVVAWDEGITNLARSACVVECQLPCCSRRGLSNACKLSHFMAPFWQL